MQEEIIKFETAKLAKEKGLKQKAIEIGFSYYKPDGEKLKITEYSTEFVKYCIPYSTQSLLQRWLREEYNINIFITEGFHKISKYKVYTKPSWGEFKECDTYEEALEIGLQEALKLIKNK